MQSRPRNDIDWRTLAGKAVAIFESHQYALIPWTRWTRARTRVRLITIDHHCDTHPAFLRASFDNTTLRGDEPKRLAMIQAINPADEASIERAVGRLYNDEHIDAAVRAGVLDVAFVIAEQDARSVKSREDKEYSRRRDALEGVERLLYTNRTPRPQPPMNYDMPDDRMVAIDPPRYLRNGMLTDPWPDRAIESDHLDDRLRIFDEICANAGEPGVFDADYILDIDLDAFNTRKALAPDDATTFQGLIRRAVGITIARETQCFDECWDDDVRIGVDQAQKEVLAHIENALTTAPSP